MCLATFVGRKITLVDYKNIDIKKLRNFHFVQRGWSILLFKNLKFLCLEFFGQVDYKECLAKFLIEKISFSRLQHY